MAPWISSFPKYVTMAFPKNSPYRSIMNQVLTNIAESGMASNLDTLIM